MDFIFRDNWMKRLEVLRRQVKWEVEEAVVRYGTTRELIPLKAEARRVFDVIRMDIDAEAEEKEKAAAMERARVEQRRELERERQRRHRASKAGATTPTVTLCHALSRVTEKERKTEKEKAPFVNPSKEKEKIKEKGSTTTTRVREASELELFSKEGTATDEPRRDGVQDGKASGPDSRDAETWRRIEASTEEATRENTEHLRYFFAHSSVALESLCMQLKVSPKKLKALADEVVNEWLLTGERHHDYTEWARHLISVLRFKAQAKAIEEKRGSTPEERNARYYDGLRRELNINDNYNDL